MMHRRESNPVCVAVAVLLAVCLAAAAPAQINEVPREFQGLDVQEKLEARLPLELKFVDDRGVGVHLGAYFNQNKPVVLVPVYYRCPMLCGLTLSGLVDGLRELPLEPGKDYELVALSFDPLEEPKLARSKKETYLREFGRPGAAHGWHFLTGDNEPLHALLSSVGFKYRWSSERQEWIHPSTAILCTPDGRVSRYLGGPAFEGETLRLSLTEAGGGRIGSLFDRVFLMCFHWEPSIGKYTANVKAMMRFGAGITVVLVALLLIGLKQAESIRRARARRREQGQGATTAGSTS